MKLWGEKSLNKSIINIIKTNKNKAKISFNQPLFFLSYSFTTQCTV